MIRNKTKSTTLVKTASYCKTIYSQAKGLMFSKPLKDQCLVFVFKNSKKTVLHMFFVFFPIDIVFLNNKKRVVEVMENVKPFTPFIKSKNKAKYIIELPSRTINKSKTNINDLIEF